MISHGLIAGMVVCVLLACLIVVMNHFERREDN